MNSCAEAMTKDPAACLPSDTVRWSLQSLA
jgi:hypothetical protein